ncbi:MULTISPECIES: DUF3243 domain-containing protein [Bacillota]|uniref:DUF3243 domain-containing protein n=1 Tax=Virgibacillus pantothenticus TaxID=1473 RepID=A0A0L0QNM9_VIRPA|nr:MULTISPECIES: DUF3243 domain-containing protein [Bacillota]API93951.1 hypothetical protein BKP57_20240 [Virgibacillus sp. 6R]KNE20235.1 hypothetical protein AFK71_17750 [Virgibacillus pantothenticus]MBS7427504.1 DUF3243 domain-containing protein [Virgibacillus sp. 19R1-5]MBU8566006.1 DUF3243 domain-containing protein [Virgibacillus pantothenticus]MBU8600983.1 DUF3243 domain-containing protein [Virgibacillus pantothenticus]
MSVLDNFDSWRSFLANKLTQAQQQGMSNDTIQNVAHEIGDYLAQHVDAKNKEEAVLRDLWNAASDEEQQALANTMIKYVQNQGNQS